MKEEICLALGFFDCVHYGHRVIIQMMKEAAQRFSCKSVVSTFSDAFFKRGESVGGLVYTAKERQCILRKLGVDDVLVFEFDDAFKNLSAEDFLDRLCQTYNIRYVACGYDYRYGKDGAGNVEHLRQFCTRRDIDLEVSDKICLDGKRVSSEDIKDFIANGQIERANELLCSRYFISAPVVRGRGEGRLNGLPTANMDVAKNKQMPKSGVYATETLIDGMRYCSVTNVGAKPSYGDFSYGVETFIDGYSGDLYSKTITVEFCKFLRSIEHFDSIQKLKQQIEKDLINSKEFR